MVSTCTYGSWGMTIGRLFKCMGLRDGVNQERQGPVDGRGGSEALNQLSRLVASWMGLHKYSGVLLTCPVLLPGVCCACAFVVCSHCSGELVTVEMFRLLWLGGSSWKCRVQWVPGVVVQPGGISITCILVCNNCNTYSLIKGQNKERELKASEEKRQVTYKVRPIRKIFASIEV